MITFHPSADGSADYLDLHTPDGARFYLDRAEARRLAADILRDAAEDVACKHCGRLNGVHSISADGQVCVGAERWLTAADPEPAAGTTVEMESGQRWTRYEGMAPGSWLVEGGEADSDPETWRKIAGNYGPVRIVRRPS